tara:strand:- start:10467 stop:12761 length:2295 start_codon:yes stop_codon:yes gene_type:complete
MIPKKIFQSFETHKLPYGMSKATESWKLKNKGYDYKFFDAEDRVLFIKSNFHKEVLDAYFALVPGAFKCDLWRLCVLYVEGGVYIDADTICETPLDEFILPSDKFIITRDDPMSKKYLGNAFIAASVGHPFLKEAIDRIVKNCQSKQEIFYLDYSGPALMGKSVNHVLGNDIEAEYELGQQGDIKIMKHDFARTKYTFDGKDILHVEYPGKVAEMDTIGNIKFWDHVQARTIFNHIPRKIIYTTKDVLDINQYMIDSFEKHNPDYDLVYFDDNAVEQWFAKSIYNKAYKNLKEKGARTDFFRYCYLWENGGIYVDADTFCNQPLDNWIQGQTFIAGLEACLDKDNKFFDTIGVNADNNMVSVANWFIAAAPKAEPLGEIINDIINNPVNGVLQNTGPGRFTKHVIAHFGYDHDFTTDIQHGKSQLLSINRVGSNQGHSNAIKHDVFSGKDADKSIYITHLFEGSWRDETPRQNLIPYKTEFCSHNLSLWKNGDGYKGIARLDSDTSRTEFMKQLGDCRSLYEFDFNADLTLKDVKSRDIKHDELSKWEDYRTVIYKGKPYHFASYIDKNWNTTTAILDEDYNFIKQLEFDEPNKMSFIGDKEVTWYKNLLPFIHNDELHFIYNTSPNYKVYKHTGDWEFDKIIDVENHLHHKFPPAELYFTAACKIGGSTAPIWFEDQQCYIYVVHTKLYAERAYNHYAVKLDKDLNIIDIAYKPFISRKIPYALFFITGWILEGDYVTLSGGLEDNTNWTWKIPKSLLYKSFN